MFKKIALASLLSLSLLLISCEPPSASSKKRSTKKKTEKKEEPRTVSSDFRHKLITRKGTKVFKDVLKNKEKVILVWGADWHPVSRKFVPMLAKKYKTLKKLGFEVIYISNARSYKAYKKYVSKMPWLILDYKYREKVRAVSENNPMDVPYIAILNKECIATVVGKGDSVMRSLKLEYPELAK